MNNDINNDNNLSNQLQPTQQFNEQPIGQTENNNVSVNENVGNTNPPVAQAPAEVNQPSVQNNEPKNKKSNLSKILILVVVLALAGVGVFFLLNSGEKDPEEGPKNEESDKSSSSILLEDAKISGYGCIDSVCSLSVGDFDNEVEYSFDNNKQGILKELSDYTDYIKVNIYYKEESSKKTIVDFEIFLRSNGSKIENIKTEEELREKVGLFNAGEYTESLTLDEKDEYPAYGIGENEETYLIFNYTFVDDNNTRYEMKYKTETEGLDLEVGNKYTVKFNVEKGSFDYEYIIVEVK